MHAQYTVKYHRPTHTYRILDANGAIVDRYQHTHGDFDSRRAMYRLALEDVRVRNEAALQSKAVAA